MFKAFVSAFVTGGACVALLSTFTVACTAQTDATGAEDPSGAAGAAITEQTASADEACSRGGKQDLLACETDADCVAIPDPALCCPNGTKTAVAAKYERAYIAEHACQEKPQICPMYLVLERRVAECLHDGRTGKGRCAMVAPEDIQCGGFIAPARQHHCPEGYACEANRIPDLPGSCVEAPKPQACGGIAGIACPAGQQCVDDPSDTCDPAHGGADCGGICVDAPTCHDNVMCIKGDHWDATQCKCVPDAPACHDVMMCIKGDHWDATQCKCVPDAPACHDVMMCMKGQHWDATKCTCVPDAPACHETAMCIKGDHWDATQCKCVPDANDCRTTGCGADADCSFCWGGYACLPHGAVC